MMANQGWDFMMEKSGCRLQEKDRVVMEKLIRDLMREMPGCVCFHPVQNMVYKLG